ncbi:HSP70-domain-containing protein [Acephala macrosclerotiorum]|nr:HSP70-domain-containing protein [Acephala macrosclerotiorum]
MRRLAKNAVIFLVGLVAALCLSTIFQSRAKDWPGYFDEINVGLRQFWWRVRYNQQSGEEKWDRVIGIELGRTFSRVGVFRDNSFELIHDEQNRSVVPSYVAFTGNGPPLVGYAALDQAAENPANTIYDLSLLIGRKLMDPEVLAAIKTFPFKVTQHDDIPEITIPGDELDQGFTPSEISAMVIARLKTIAETHLNETVSHAIITVPDDFHEDQREATRDAAKMAGVEAVRIVSESTAAGIGYGFDIPYDPYGSKTDSEYFVVYHLDAKESKLALLSVDRGVFEHLAVVKDGGLGGEVFDNDFIEDMRLKEAAVDLVKELLEKAELDKSKLDGLVFTGNPAHVVSI